MQGDVTLFISEEDRYVDAPTIYADAAALMERHRGQQQQLARDRDAVPDRRPRAVPSASAGLGGGRTLRAFLWKGSQHGEFLGDPSRRREVIDRVIPVGDGVAVSQ